VIGRLRRRRPFADQVTTTGARVVLVGRPLVDNQGRIEVADDARIESRPSPTHLATGPAGTMRIGRRVRIGQGVALSSLGLVDIGDDAVLGDFVMIMDSDFHVAGDEEATADPLPVRIGAGARIGHRAVILPGATVGAGATVAAGSVVAGAVADGVRVAGNPAVPVRPGAAAATSVADVVATTFGLDGPPGPDLGPDDVPAWDSLGALRLLIEVEGAFGVTLDDRAAAAVRSVGDLERLVAATIAPAADAAP
jgi:acetyltransferase-like isoleucine patch superfamily enzyme/acyl carrier protein